MEALLQEIAENEGFSLPILQNPSVNGRFRIQKLHRGHYERRIKPETLHQQALDEFKRQFDRLGYISPFPVYEDGDPVQDAQLLELALGASQADHFDTGNWDLPKLIEPDDLGTLTTSIAACEEEEIQERLRSAHGALSQKIFYKELFQFLNISNFMSLHRAILRDEACPLIQWKLTRMPPWIPVEIFSTLMEGLFEFLKDLVELSIEYMHAAYGTDANYLTEAAVKAAVCDLGIDKLGTQFPHILESLPDESVELPLNAYRLTEIGCTTPLDQLRQLLQ